MSCKIVYGTKGEEILVDTEDYKKVNLFNWNCSLNGRVRYARRFFRPSDTKKLGSQSMHRLILNEPEGQVDHINGNGLDNRKENLRICTVQQNSCNRRKVKNSSSKYLGVTFHKRDKKWQAQIKTNKKPIFLGYFKTEIDAAKAYNSAALKYHGQFAKLNKV